MGMVVTVHGDGCHSTWGWLSQYMGMVVTVHGDGCHSTWRWLSQYMGMVVTPVDLSCTWGWLSQYMGMVVTVHGDGCHSTWGWLSQYMAMVVTVHGEQVTITVIYMGSTGTVYIGSRHCSHCSPGILLAYMAPNKPSRTTSFSEDSDGDTDLI